MELSYWMYKEEFDRKKDVVDKEVMVEMEIMDLGEKIWQRAEIMIYQQPAPKSKPAGLLGPFGEPHAEGKYHIKVLKILPSPLDD